MVELKVSPSKVKTFRQCPRKFWFEVVAGNRDIPRAPVALEKGKKIHAILESRLRGRAIGGEGVLERTANAMYGALDDKGLLRLPVIGIEHKFVMQEKNWPLERGVIDLFLRDTEAVVVDHKTTSNFKWCVPEDLLPADPQAVIYSRYALQNFEAVRFILNYGKVGTKKTEWREHRYRASEIIERHNQLLEEDVRPLITVWNTDRAKDVPYQPWACGDFGGCHCAPTCIRLGVPGLH